jgi:transcriptional regulator with XRE-family HTH domain
MYPLRVHIVHYWVAYHPLTGRLDPILLMEAFMDQCSMVLPTSEKLLSDLSGRLRSNRKAAGKTQAEAAQICDVSHRTFKDYELGRRLPPIDALMRFCAALGIDPVELFFGRSGHTHEASATAAEEVAIGVMKSFGLAEEVEIKRRARLARYAWDNAKTDPFRMSSMSF